MNQVLRDRSFKLSIILTLIFFSVGMAFFLLGFAELGWVLFGLLPIVLGISIGALPNRKWALAGAVIAAIIFLLSLLSLGLSGFICVIMTLPLIIPFIFLGSVITHLAKRYREIKADSFRSLLLPLLPFLIAAPAEHYLTETKQVIEVRTEKIFSYTPEQVYDAIKSVDTLDAEKPFLMKLDLPVPTKCVLEKEEVGGRRVCYFNGGNLSNGDFGRGTIVEKVTKLERGKVLQMDVVEYDLIGRKWLGFKEAIYYFERVKEDQCKLIRITTYTSELAPRFYWEPMEKWGIIQEHDYVFANLEKDLKNSFGKASGYAK